MEHFITPDLASRSAEMESERRSVMDNGQENVKVEVVISVKVFHCRDAALTAIGNSSCQPVS